MAGFVNFVKKLFGWSEPVPRRRKVTKRQVSKDSYLLAYRYAGYPKKYFSVFHSELQSTFRIAHPNYHYVPHVSIAGPIFTSHEHELIAELQRIIFDNAHNFHEPGNLVGTGKFTHFETDVGGRVLAIEIKPSLALVDLKDKILSALAQGDIYQCQNYKEHIWHTTVWNMKANSYADKEKFKRVWAHLNAPQEMKFILDRITLVKNDKILNEFDLVNLKTLGRIVALDNNRRYESYQKIKAELTAKGESFNFSDSNAFRGLRRAPEEQAWDDETVPDDDSADLKDERPADDGTVEAEWDY